MKILFTKSNRWFSDLICSITGEPISHCAIELVEEQIVIHSNFRGLHIETSKNFREKCEKIIEVPIERDTAKLNKMLDKYEHSWYDIGAMFFLALSLLLRDKIGIPLPKSNLWQATGMFLCTEWVTFYLDEKEDSMITPYKLYERIVENAT